MLPAPKAAAEDGRIKSTRHAIRIIDPRFGEGIAMSVVYLLSCGRLGGVMEGYF
jgi:hypothetical protein